MIPPLTHQQQPTNDSCTSTCIAMILNVPAQKVIDEFHLDFCKFEKTPDEYLLENGVASAIQPPWARVNGEGLYLLTVPSLNQEGWLHDILYHVYPHEEPDLWNHVILDPNYGKEGKKHYKHEFCENVPLGVKLMGYTVDLKIMEL